MHISSPKLHALSVWECTPKNPGGIWIQMSRVHPLCTISDQFLKPNDNFQWKYVDTKNPEKKLMILRNLCVIFAQVERLWTQSERNLNAIWTQSERFTRIYVHTMVIYEQVRIPNSCVICSFFEGRWSIDFFDNFECRPSQSWWFSCPKPSLCCLGNHTDSSGIQPNMIITKTNPFWEDPLSHLWILLGHFHSVEDFHWPRKSVEPILRHA